MRIVLVFAGCYRSQFSANHKAIKEFLANTWLFGFTDTSIFEDNAIATQVEQDVATLGTSQDLFGKEPMAGKCQV